MEAMQAQADTCRGITVRLTQLGEPRGLLWEGVALLWEGVAAVCCFGYVQYRLERRRHPFSIALRF